MFDLPESFNENEWFVIVSMIVLSICFIKTPRMMCREWIASIFLWFANLGLGVDILLGIDYPFDFYQIMDTPKLELFDILVYFVNYPLYGYFFAYIMYKWIVRKDVLLLFVLIWCGLTAALEAFSVHFHVFTYLHGWTLGRSFLVYLVIYSFSAAVLKGFQRIWQNST